MKRRHVKTIASPQNIHTRTCKYDNSRSVEDEVERLPVIVHLVAVHDRRSVRGAHTYGDVNHGDGR